MENNTEEKAFKAQYWGQNVLHQNIQGHEITPFDEGYAVNERTISWKGTYLLLNSLESITEEHAIEVAKIHGTYNGDAPPQIKSYKFGIEIMARLLPCADYLRKNGYAVPFDGKPVEELISLGWVKIKQT